MSAVDGKKRTAKRMSEEQRQKLSEAAHEQHFRRRGFIIPEGMKAEAVKVYHRYYNRHRKGPSPEFMKAALGLCLVLFMAMPALGHTSDGGMAYDPACCNSARTSTYGDCDRVPQSSVRIGPAGYEVTLHRGDHALVKDAPITFTVPFGKERVSTDGDYHACLKFTAPWWRCFYAPPGSM